MKTKYGLWVVTSAIALASFAPPNLAWACACGCGVFAVGDDAMAAPGRGGRISLEYDFMDQDHNRGGQSSSDPANNPDKEIRTHFVTLNGQFTLNRDWAVTADIPVWSRTFRTENDEGTGVDRFDHTALGDIRLNAIYTGLLPDKSLGLTLGLKLPTGDWTYAGFDRDTEIGTGTTDILAGVYKRSLLSADRLWSGFAGVLVDVPLSGRAGYRPGLEVDGAAGVSYGGFSLSDGRVVISPLLQLVASARAVDAGPAADPVGSGYERLVVSPGVAIDAGKWRIQSDIGFPVYQRVRGQQLTAPVLLKVRLSHAF